MTNEAQIKNDEIQTRVSLTRVSLRVKTKRSTSRSSFKECDQGGS